MSTEYATVRCTVCRKHVPFRGTEEMAKQLEALRFVCVACFRAAQGQRREGRN